MSPLPDTRRVAGVVHPCLTALPRPFPLAGARLTDRARAGVLLQAAGLLSLLERAGWRTTGWSEARTSAAGELGAGAEPGRAAEPAQALLLDLAVRLFGAETVPGRGEARRAVRIMLDAWRQTVAPLPADETVRGILDAAPFLWEPDLAFARRALAGGLVRDGEAQAWVAGPRSFRRRLLASRPSLPDLWDLLAGPGARPLWDREEEGEPLELAASGRWRAAVAAWERRPPAGEEERIARGAALASLGRFEAALDGLSGLGSPAARALAARCQLDLQQLGAARNTLKSLEDAPLEPERVAELAEIAARVHANRGEPDRAGFWIRRALDETVGTGSPALRTRLAAAGAAWDRRDLEAMGRLLDRSRGALDDPYLAWRWHQLQALRARGDGEPDVAVEHAARALRAGRRQLTRRQAAGLWNDLGLARAGRGDLPGAERAFLHAARLEAGCDGPRKATLAFFNLAEIRLRRGRTTGVREIIARAEEENRRSGNQRGLREDAGLWARFELALGRPAAALAVCRDALRDLEADWYREELHLFAARALGWLGEREEAAAELIHVPEETLRELEPEERPAVRALAGDRLGALREAAGTPFEPLWERLLAGGPAPAPCWEPLAAMEPFRAARLVFDAEVLLPGSAPAPWRRTAAATFRETGAAPLAGILEARDDGPWIVAAACLAALRERAEESGPSQNDQSLPDPDPGGMVGESPVLRSSLDRIARLAPGDLPVLILGESGTGKELAARQIHRASSRSGGPFVAVNCAALSETLLLSDLFGHVRGAFTGAERDRKGVFETAGGGTVFLDEIGDLPLSAQGLLLRVLQEGEIRRLGESEPRRVNVRVLAATHRDLYQMAEAGTFRLDLFYRLRVGCVELPPLRERGEDVSLIADHILARLRGPRTAWLSREARALLIAHSWPGNVRELQNVLSVAATLAGFGRIDPEHLEMPRAEEPAPGSSYHQQVDAFRRELVAKALDDHGGQHAGAARQLGVSRQTFSYLVRRFGLASPRRNDQPAV
ncbi:MAG TPA: sigma 54-interacting transcriptional regulator [Thermoanaerobaculia bacterium]